MKKKAPLVIPILTTQSSNSRRSRKEPTAMPQILRPALPPLSGRRMVDSALGSRPNSSRSTASSESEDSGRLEIDRLPLHSHDSIVNLESELLDSPPTSRSSSLLAFIPGLSSSDPLPALDQLSIQVHQWANDSVISLDFRVYHLLTQSLFELICRLVRSGTRDSTFFKVLAFCVRVMPASDRVPLEIVIKLLYRMSQRSEFDLSFSECHLLKPLMDLAFGSYAEISTTAAAILRHIAASKVNAEGLLRFGVVKVICLAVRTDVRRDRFSQNLALWVYQVIGLFSALYDSLNDFKLICRYSLPRSLLELITIYSTDIGIQSAVSKALALMMTREDCVEIVEDAELTPFFILMNSRVNKILNLSALALANAMFCSPLVVDAVVELGPPIGVFGLCEILKSTSNLEIQVSLMRCLAKASETQQGIQIIQLYMQVIDRLLELEMDELESWSPEQLVVANAVIVIKNFAKIELEKAAAIMKGKMDRLMVYGIVDYVIELMRELMKCEAGREVCREVKHVTEIQLILGDF